MNDTTKRLRWREVRHLFSPEAVKVFEASEANGHGETILLDGNVESHLPVIHPVPRHVFSVGFRDTPGEYHHELELAVHPNAFSVRYVDGSLSARPPYPVFTINDGTPSYQPQIGDIYEGLTGPDVKEIAFDWLSRRPLIAFLFKAGGNTIVGEYIAPVEMAHVLIGFNLVHQVPAYHELKDLRPADTSFFCAPGLRRSIFGGQQNVGFELETKGRITIIGNSIYRGCQNKKPIFVALSWRFAEQGAMACHASMARPQVQGAAGDDCVVMMACDSGRGKTEVRKAAKHYRNASGELILGHRSQGGSGRILTVPYYPECHPQWFSHGDDGLKIVIRNEQGGLLTLPLAENWEWGAFDRNSGAYGSGDIPELDKILKRSKWWNLITDNLRANPGDELYHWNRVMVEGNPSPNPRLTYPNTLLADAGVATSQAPLSVRHSLLAFAPVEGVTCTGPWTKLNRGLAALYEILGGPDAVRSKSVSAVPAGKVVKQRRVKFGHIGTMAQFSALPLKLQVNQVLALRGSCPEMTCHLVTQERLPAGFETNGSTALKEIEYVPELLIRDLLYSSAIGRGRIDWIPSPYPFLGYVPRRVILGDTELPPEYFDPLLIYGDRLQRLAEEWFNHIVAELGHMQQLGVSEIAAELFDAVRGLYSTEGKVVPLAPEESERRMNRLAEIVDKAKGMRVVLE